MKIINLRNDKLINENIVEKKYTQLQCRDVKRVVDINRLLNRVKLDKKIQIKKRLFFFSMIILILSLLGTLIAIVR